ncbi:hypothetical protein JZO72_03790 [Vagococcus fluvialis]|uniref:hypothetical protein n=1 Tax=Vagococcus fluvialis TaxID=2738 RepID=UPI001A8EB9C5|nr:hypothetical protein [Vagococcus fluvialis]MBO0478743.1 hypothetical protein [Vagococcus fluvialis]MBO0484412.1 hypothetical protein [Vagococcus fluvialis]
MVMHSFDVGKGVYQFAPSHKPKRNMDWKNELLEKVAMYNKMTVDQVKKYLEDE